MLAWAVLARFPVKTNTVSQQGSHQNFPLPGTTTSVTLYYSEGVLLTDCQELEVIMLGSSLVIRPIMFIPIH